MSLLFNQTCLNKILLPNYTYFNIYIYKQDLALNNLQGLICCKTQPTKKRKTYPITWFGHRGTTHVSCLGKNDLAEHIPFQVYN